MRLPSLTRVSLKKARWTGGGWGKRRETLISPFQAPRARPVGGLRHPDPRVPGSARLGGVTPRSFFFFKETLSFLVGVFKTHTKGERRRKKKDDDRSAQSIAEGGGGRGGERRGSRQEIDPSGGPDPVTRGRFSSLSDMVEYRKNLSRRMLERLKLSPGNIHLNLDSKDGCDGQSTGCCGKCHQENHYKFKKDDMSQQERRENGSNETKKHSK